MCVRHDALNTPHSAYSASVLVSINLPLTTHWFLVLPGWFFATHNFFNGGFIIVNDYVRM